MKIKTESNRKDIEISSLPFENTQETPTITENITVNKPNMMIL